MDDYRVMRCPTLGRTVYWYIVRMRKDGGTTRVKRCKSKKEAQAIIDRWETMPDTWKEGHNGQE